MAELKRKIKVLVVEDSLVFRETLARGLANDQAIEIVATAADPYVARDKILEYEPDVMTLDVELPRMNGIEFLKRLMPQYPLPVIVVSAISDKVFDALNAGAVDFVTKPDSRAIKNVDIFIAELIVKVKIASTANVKKQISVKKPSSVMANPQLTSRGIIAIGASTGGTEAIYTVLKELPAGIPGIVVVQHMPPVFTKMYAERLNSSCVLEVKEAQTGDRVTPGKVLIAPGDSHMKLRKISGDYVVDCTKGEKVNGHCPSVDVLFNSVAEQAGNAAVGIILTGMGSDGAKGLMAMRLAGARTIGQDEQSSVVYGMPKTANDIGAVEIQLPLVQIPNVLHSIIYRR